MITVALWAFLLVAFTILGLMALLSIALVLERVDGRRKGSE